MLEYRRYDRGCERNAQSLSCLRHFILRVDFFPAVNGWANFFRADGALRRRPMALLKGFPTPSPQPLNPSLATARSNSTSANVKRELASMRFRSLFKLIANYQMLMRKLTLALLALLLLAGCSSNQPASETKKTAAAPKQAEYKTGRVAFQEMYLSARGWAGMRRRFGCSRNSAPTLPRPKAKPECGAPPSPRLRSA